jgi:glycoprotein-N-acetylgalactosamine 3-beta-galactosyltransferase
MLRKICRFQKCAFSIGFVIGVILACLHINSEKETKCKVEDIFEISYRRWFSMQNFKKYPVNYSGTAAAAQISQASYLHNVVHVHCVVFVKKTKNAVAIQNTWAKHCNEIVFFGVKNSSAVSLTVLKPKSSWQYLCDGIRHLWKYNKADLHWALFVPDDVFVVPENLRYYVASLNYNEPHYLGDDVTFWGNVYNVGEAGYVLSKGAIYALQMKFNSSELCHKSGKYWRNEDFYLGKYMF